MFQSLCCSDAILAMFVSISEFDDFLQLVYHAGSFCVSVKIPLSQVVRSPRRRLGEPENASPVQASGNCKHDLVQLSSLLHLSCGWPRVTLFHPLTTSHPVTPLHALLRSPHTTFSDHRGRVRPPLTTTRFGGIIPTPLFCIR